MKRYKNPMIKKELLQDIQKSDDWKGTTWRDTKIRWLKRNYIKIYKYPMIEKELNEDIQKSDDWKGTT